MKVAVIGRARSLIRFRGALLTVMVEAGHDVTVFAAELTDDLREGLSELGVSIESYPLSRAGLGPVNDWRTYRALVDGFSRLRPDVTLAYNIKPVIYAGLAAGRVGGIASWSIITGLGHLFTGQSLKTRVIRWLITPLYRRALHINVGQFFQNADDRQELAALGICDPNRSTLVAGSGVSTQEYAPCPLPEGAPVFLFVGRFLKEKGINELVEAARLLKGNFPDMTIQLVGSTDENPSSLSAEALEALERSGVVTNLGWLDDVRPAIRTSSVMVLPSYREGTPRAVLEAMSMGRAIITTDAPGCRETVTDGHNGLLVPVGDVGALVDAMASLYADPERVSRMGQASIQSVQTRFDVRLVNQAMMAAMGL